MKKFKFTIGENKYEVEVQSFEGDKAQVVVNGAQYEVEVEREKEFAPVKNATGVDSVESARELLQKNGIEI